MYNVLVTGGAGFIGSHFIEQLLADENKYNTIVVLDNLSTGKIENLPVSPKVKFIKGDVTEPELLKNICIDYNFDYIIHLAAVASVQESIENPEYTHKVNFDSTLFLLENARKSIKLKRFIFAGSAAVYGDKPSLPCRESDPVNPLTPYGVDKYASERYVVNYYKLYKLPTVAFRFFNIYGPRQNPSSPYSGVISIFNKCFKELNPEVKIFGDGQQCRDFIFVKDLVDILNNSLTNEQMLGNVYNAGTGVETTLLDIILSFERLTGKKAQINWFKDRPGDIKKSVADINLLSQVCKNKNFYNIGQGLELLLTTKIN